MVAANFEMLPQHWDRLNKSGDRYKQCYGHAAIVSGPSGKGGAARLAARGALRIGAGLVSVVCSDDARQEHAAHLDAIMVKPFGNSASFTDCLIDIGPDAMCIGPNLGLDHLAKTVFLDGLLQSCPKCIDADAITLLSQNPTLQLSPQDVMTPHEGELRRYIPAGFAQTSCRETLARIAAEKVNSVVLFKGSDTIIAAPNGACSVVTSQGYKNVSWLATAGSGDVLSGFITGLLARGFSAFDAACTGAYLHLECAELFGPGLIAEDIPEMLPRVFNAAYRACT
ncbi:MAG: NAD(P)H-hydrate dehydratase [Yoonia sp.]|nr:NAD(P)H-hydrate dehydratase [Yoonia sp.]